MKLRSIRQAKGLRGKRVLVRVDFNLPLGPNGSVADDWRIRRVAPTVDYLVKRGARVALLSHLGRPKGAERALRMDAVSDRLDYIIKRPVRKLNDCVGPSVEGAVQALGPGEIVLLENVRFHPGEEKNDPKFARELARVADIYINDAFAVSHRAAASVVGVTKYLPSYAGLLMEEEVKALSKLLGKPKRPFVVLIGGAKIETKIGVIKNFLRKADSVLLGGALVLPFIKALHHRVGSSKVDPKEIRIAAGLIRNKKIELPVDLVVETMRRTPAVRWIDKVGVGETIYDIGPETIRRYAEILRRAETIVWNGPLGKFEEKRYSHGTIALGRFVATRSKGPAFGVVGGGETIQALKLTKMEEYVDFISTGGGAMLEFLEGKMLPGIKPLVDRL
ncbi:phosphoglycerate kinase [Candidatus Uhrbacteria bacterium RIFCSPHIGHO2_12_FULL_57_11]|uniref:Phosphoglycerate kinase n=2 Tax=Candidatus Uhriibacteriota TaxID=1752732 RepID=A0A1F7UIK9_9BACT|nr:MAG: phosphoglycerate kinase [Candidatus Uhrbacteria bacterium RIFCSPHIGHO2_02_FULL_57_19]OGL77568.1 MAG: phosphoglycerate kinase [Candidatus Uhrbacteria bacterium RIFCSPHIGHO2_12_FULL_57_11]